MVRTADLDRKLRTVGGQPAFSSLCLGLHVVSVRVGLKAYFLSLHKCLSIPSFQTI